MSRITEQTPLGTALRPRIGPTSSCAKRHTFAQPIRCSTEREASAQPTAAILVMLFPAPVGGSDSGERDAPLPGRARHRPSVSRGRGDMLILFEYPVAPSRADCSAELRSAGGRRLPVQTLFEGGSV